MAILIGVCVPACTHGSEQLLLEQFFSASRLRDRAALERVATVMFEPREHGTISAFTISNVTAVETSAKATSKQVTVSAEVRRRSGDTVAERIVLILERRDEGSDSRWVVTGFTVLDSSRSGSSRAGP